ncbi:MAG: hypothetical protein E6I87_01675 [Chloroflexi bacterium]|nr:MAG: hypothetical protein E6I87_01675 [Chloroflexota bacterium]
MLERVARIVTDGPFTADRIKTALDAYAAEIGWKPKEVHMPVRIAVTGKRVGPPLFESMLLLGRERTLERLRDAIARLSDPVAA